MPEPEDTKTNYKETKTKEEEKEWYCPKCNARIYPGNKVCPKCKDELDWSEEENNAQKKSQKSDIILKSKKSTGSESKNAVTLVSSIIAIILSILGLINLLKTGFSNDPLWDFGWVLGIIFVFLWGISGIGKIIEAKGSENSEKKSQY
jgi:uncharacterized protein YbaR (Trm112 family)